VTLRADVDGRLPDPVETGAYYIICEALANAAKHAQATVVEVAIEQRRQFLNLTVRDNGTGGADGSGPGLTGLADRVDALTGTMQLLSPPGRGTRLFIKLPVRPGGDGAWPTARSQEARSALPPTPERRRTANGSPVLDVT
jgi:signal transduction histidine kinase